MAHYIGVDLHKAFFQVCAVTETGTRVWETRFPTTEAGIAGLVARDLRDATVVVEASGPTWWFVDQLRAADVNATVIDAGRTRLKAGYAAKTDRLDARRLADAARRDSVVRVYYPAPAVRDARELVRYRISLVRTATSLRQRIRALCLRHGVTIPVTDLAGAAGQAAVRAITLPGWAGQSLTGHLALLHAVVTAQAPLDATIRALAQTDRIAQALDTVHGIGPILAVTLRVEIADITRFPTGAHLASYAGLVSKVTASGGRRPHYGPITKRGSAWLRWALVEAAIHGTRRTDAFGRWARQLAQRRGALKARVGIARALCTEIHRTWPR